MTYLQSSFIVFTHLMQICFFNLSQQSRTQFFRIHHDDHENSCSSLKSSLGHHTKEQLTAHNSQLTTLSLVLKTLESPNLPQHADLASFRHPTQSNIHNGTTTLTLPPHRPRLARPSSGQWQTPKTARRTREMRAQRNHPV